MKEGDAFRKELKLQFNRCWVIKELDLSSG